VWDLVGPVLSLLLLWLISLYGTHHDIGDSVGGIFGILCPTGCDAMLISTDVPNDRISSSSWSGCEKLLDPAVEGQST